MHIYQHAWEQWTARAPAHITMNAAIQMGTHYMVQQGMMQQLSTEFPIVMWKNIHENSIEFSTNTQISFKWVIFLLILLVQKGIRIYKTTQIPVLKSRNSEITWWCFHFMKTRVQKKMLSCLQVFGSWSNSL